MSWREGPYGRAQRGEQAGFACECDIPVPVIAVEKRTDSDRIPCGYEAFSRIIYYGCILRIKHGEHLLTVFVKHVEQYSASSMANIFSRYLLNM